MEVRRAPILEKQKVRREGRSFLGVISAGGQWLNE
jgi:hypothetical protein